jgi:hypothetical protein
MRSLALTALAGLLVAATATATWGGSGRGNVAARARTLGTGMVPTAAASTKKVVLSWAGSTFLEGGAVPAYVVRRYNATTGQLQPIGATCATNVTALTCTENNVPNGAWRYTVTPAAGSWRGGESAKSSTVTIL